MTPPDSDAREACGYHENDEGWDSHWDAHSTRRCGLRKGHALPHDYAPVLLPLSLAQRILAALEEHRGCVACPVLARELRAVIGK